MVRGQNLKSQLPTLVSVLMNFRECREFSLLVSRGGRCAEGQRRAEDSDILFWSRRLVSFATPMPGRR